MKWQKAQKMWNGRSKEKCMILTVKFQSTTQSVRTCWICIVQSDKEADCCWWYYISQSSTGRRSKNGIAILLLPICFIDLSEEGNWKKPINVVLSGVDNSEDLVITKFRWEATGIVLSKDLSITNSHAYISFPETCLNCSKKYLNEVLDRNYLF